MHDSMVSDHETSLLRKRCLRSSAPDDETECSDGDTRDSQAAMEKSKRRDCHDMDSVQPRNTSQSDSDGVMLSTALLATSSVWRRFCACRAHNEACASQCAARGVSQDSRTCASAKQTPTCVPAFKVGTREMYKYHAEAYEHFMRHHDCSSVSDYLVNTILQRIVRTRAVDSSPCSATMEHDSGSNPHAHGYHGSTSNGSSLTRHDSKQDGVFGITCPEMHDRRHTSSHCAGTCGSASSPMCHTAPFIAVADFGCGTGRVEQMLLRHPCVRCVHAYDNATAMLDRCLVNTVRTACGMGHWDRIVLVPRSVSPTRSQRATQQQQQQQQQDEEEEEERYVCLAQRHTLGSIMDHSSYCANWSFCTSNLPPTENTPSSAKIRSTLPNTNDNNPYKSSNHNNDDVVVEGGKSSRRERARSTAPKQELVECAAEHSPCHPMRTSSSTPWAQRTLTLCVRPYSFAHVQRGYLRQQGHARCQLLVCAWSLSYVMREQWGNGRWHDAVDAVIGELYELLDNRTCDAALVVIETLGNDSSQPTRNNTLMNRLEEKFGFVRWWGQTNYNFDSVAQAVHMMRFFFGTKVAQQVHERQATSRMECTGVWTLWKPRCTE